MFTPSVGAVNHIEILNATAGNGPTIRPAGLSANQPLNLASRGTGIISCVGNQLRVTGNTAAAAGILELRGGNASLSGGQIRLYEVTTNGTNYIGFQAPDILASNLFFELPATDGTPGQALSTNGAGILSFASYLPSLNPAATGAMTVTNSGNVVPLTITNTGTANSFVVNDIAGDATPFIIDASGLVGIGVSAPLQPLHVGRSGSGVVARFTDNSTMTLDYGIVASAGVYIDNANSGYIQFRIGGVTKLEVGASGVIKAADVYTTTVGATNRDVFVDDTGVIGYVSSTRASKTNIATLESNNIEWLQKLRPVSFSYKKRVNNNFTDEADAGKHFGLIAEEAFAANPDLCFFDVVDGKAELRGVSYSKLIAPLLRWVQILEQRVLRLEQLQENTK